MSGKQRTSREEDERLMGISAILFLPILIGGSVYLVYLYATDVIDYYQGILYTFLLLVPIYLCLCFAIYEVLFNRRTKKPLLFHFKRFLSRIAIILGYLLCILALWSVLNLYLNQLISWKYILFIAFFTASLMLAILVAIPKTRQLIKKFSSGE
jgi:hypothetical protein